MLTLGAVLLALTLPLGLLGGWLGLLVADTGVWNPTPAEAFFCFSVWITGIACLLAGTGLLAFARARTPSPTGDPEQEP